ncbi:MAG: hypothetical protein AAGJ87_01430, partial [Pseudomonadota bacterium]
MKLRRGRSTLRTRERDLDHRGTERRPYRKRRSFSIIKVLTALNPPGVRADTVISLTFCNPEKTSLFIKLETVWMRSEYQTRSLCENVALKSLSFRESENGRTKMRFYRPLIGASLCLLVLAACSDATDPVNQQVNLPPPPPTPPPPPPAAPAQSTVTILNGSGGGVFDVGSVIAITSDAPLDGQEFAQWTGDTDTVEDINSAVTTLTVPETDISISATFSDLPGFAWQSLREPSIGGRVDSIGISPHDPDLVLIGGDLLGVGRSADGGETWQSASGFLSWEISDFTFHPTDPDIIWVGTLSGPHLSEDGGVTWNPMREGLPAPEFGMFTAPVERILFDPGVEDGSSLLAFGGDHRSFSNLATNFGAVY